MPHGASVTVTGTASDVGGVVAGVEVSTDGGSSWHPAQGKHSWTYTYIQQGLGTASIRVRAIDDSANIGAPVTRNLQLTGPYSVFGQQVPAVPDSADGGAVELGMRFTPSVNGFISGVRFYKSAANTGTHSGSLWNSAGPRLATVTFTAETASGWQKAAFQPAGRRDRRAEHTSSRTPPRTATTPPRTTGPAGLTDPPLTVAGGFGAHRPVSTAVRDRSRPTATTTATTSSMPCSTPWTPRP